MSKALDLDHIFTHHPPTPSKIGNYIALREAAKSFAVVVCAHTPDCADRAAAIRHIREAVMTANAAVALDGRLHKTD